MFPALPKNLPAGSVVVTRREGGEVAQRQRRARQSERARRLGQGIIGLASIEIGLGIEVEQPRVRRLAVRWSRPPIGAVASGPRLSAKEQVRQTAEGRT